MKRMHFLTCVLSIFMMANPLQSQNFYTTPEHPVQGTSFTVVYNKAGTPLEKQAQFDATAYLFEAGQQNPTAVELAWTAEGPSLMAQVKTTPSTQAVLFSFQAQEGELFDNNHDLGYKTLLYRPDQSTPVQGANAAEALILTSFQQLGNLKRDPDTAWDRMKKEMALYPGLKSDYRSYGLFASLANKHNDSTAVAGVKADIARIKANKKSTEDQLRGAALLCMNLKDKEQAEQLGKLADERFPKGIFAQITIDKEFKEAKELADQVSIFEKAKSKLANSKDRERILNGYAATIAQAYGSKADWANMDKYLNQVTDRTRQAGVLNGLAWPMSGESLDGEAKNPAKGKELSARSMALLEEEIQTPRSKPVHFTARKWADNLSFSVAGYADTYALLAYKTGDAADALKHQTLACEKNKFEDAEMNERYTVYYEKVNGGKAAEEECARLIARGVGSDPMKAQHKRLYLANNTLESAYEKYLASLEKEAKNLLREETAKKMIELPAPDFALRNLAGEEVSLSSLRGKVVVIDFWATWCGPCKASFPGMQTAVNQFSNNKDVAFLFLDTWEKGEDKAKNAADFIASKNYTFHVLMDDKDEVVKSYGVDGIPTKFVVDRDGKIRFKAVGFSGNDDELVQEISLMIEMAGGGSQP